MRRAALAVLGTITGTTLLVGARLGTQPPLAPSAAAAPDANLPAVPAGSGSPPSGPASPGTAASAASGAPKTTGPARSSAPSGTRSTKPGSGRSAAPAPSAPGSGLKSGQFTGAGSAAGQYGTVTVTITVSGGRITNVAQTYNAQSSTSQSISGAAFPKLRQEALTAQSASIATVSGATYTSNAYKNSLQSAINSAKA